MIHACNTSTQVTEAGRLPGVQGQTTPTCKGRKERDGEKEMEKRREDGKDQPQVYVD